MRFWFALAILVGALLVGAHAGVTTSDRAVPRYDHILVIVEENKDFAEILQSKNAPELKRLALTYGVANNFYGEVHPSEGNYIAMVSGDTYGIHDDDPYYCKPHTSDMRDCPESLQPGYANHTVDAPTIADQLESHGFTWKGYYESIPSAGSLAVTSSDKRYPHLPNTAFYAAKHSAFINFRSILDNPKRREAHLVGFAQLQSDLGSSAFPNFALIVPNQCNEMHGIGDRGVPSGCSFDEKATLIARGDREVATIVAAIMRSPIWRRSERSAIVVTFDEAEGRTKGGCCGSDPHSIANFGGGKIATIVITNRGPRHLVDSRPYNHYSLLRTIEDAFGIYAYLGHAADDKKGVLPMTALFGS